MFLEITTVSLNEIICNKKKIFQYIQIYTFYIFYFYFMFIKNKKYRKKTMIRALTIY